MGDSAARKTISDRIVSWFSPEAGVRRAQARNVLAYYEAAKSDRTRKGRREAGSGNDAVLRAGLSMKQQARHFEQNYDLALGVINTLVTNIVGREGIGVEPQPRRTDGSIDEKFAREISMLWKRWCRRPEVTARHDWPSAQRMLCRSWVRDGEVFAQKLVGAVPYLTHGSVVPLSLEMIESDFVPMDLNRSDPRIVQGIEINTWGAPVAVHVYKSDPRESGLAGGASATKRVQAASMLQLANIHRIRQLRGVPVFATVLQRFDDLKDYEESERIAAKIAASMAAFIRKGTPDQYDPVATGSPRNMKFRPGMIFDDLRPGEEIGTIDTNRPNPNLETYRGGQLRAVAAATGPSYSSVARKYDGSYSSQRQELVESYGAYGVLAGEFIGSISMPVYEAFIAAAVLAGQLRVPAGIVRDTVDDAIYLAPQMPWIDPLREAEAMELLEQNIYASGPEIIRRRGQNPIDVLEQQARWVREKEERGLSMKETSQRRAGRSDPPAGA